MNKKFLSAILFGAFMLTSTGTFVSCKDYDDDIKDLQTQIDKLATKEDMTSEIARLQAALSSAAADAQAAITKATAAETAAKAAGDAAAAAQAATEKAAAEAQAAAIEAAKAEVEATKAALEKAIADGLTESKAEMAKLSAEIEEATKLVKEIVGEIAEMVTSVELVESYSATNGQGHDLGYYGSFNTINLSTAIEKENVFYKDINNAITFGDDQVQTPGSFLIRVSPANAVLTKDMISLVNSQGKNLDEMVEIIKVEKSDALLSRGATNSGLWKVTLQLKNYNKDAFNAAVTTKVGNDTKNILFAAQVNNTLSTSDVRYVTSSYDLALAWTPFNPAAELNYFVDNTNISDINNRYDATSLSLKETAANITYTELVWKSNGPAVAPITDPAQGNKVNAQKGDDRTEEKVYPAVQGKALKISLTSQTDKIVAPTNIRALFVTLDKANAVESAPSELNAWNSYTYEGLNTVVEGTSTEIIINSTTAINDIIGFRVYAVNYDGTLVDPDGKAFYVNLGNQATDWNAVATTVTAQNPNEVKPVDAKSAVVAASLTKLTGAASATWTTDKVSDDTHAFDAYFLAADNSILYKTTTDVALSDFPADFSKVAKIYTMPTLNNWYEYEDNKAYNGTLTIKNGTGHVLATINVSMTKVLPEGIPAGFSVKTSQVKEGIYNCYLIPNTWEATKAGLGTMKMTEVFNFGEGKSSNYEITFAASQWKDNAHKPLMVTGDLALSVAKDYIDDATEHATKVVYNYGKISSVKDDNGYVTVYRDAAEFKTIYNCIYNTTYTWDWATRAQLGKAYTEKNTDGSYKVAMPYSTELTYGTDEKLAADSFIFGTSAWDGRYNAMLSTPYQDPEELKRSLVIESATLTSDANGEEEYFEVEIDANKHIINFNAIAESSTTNPTAAVPSTLTIKCKDMYNHPVTITVKMTVNKR